MKNTNNFSTVILNDLFTYNKGTKTLTINEDTVFTAAEMKEAQNAYLGANRIHKPFGLLFWTDCNNGLFNNYISK